MDIGLNIQMNQLMKLIVNEYFSNIIKLNARFNSLLIIYSTWCLK